MDEQGSMTGSVLVVGGGPGGVQASLDLADSGYKVYLVEEKSSIGGMMAQLDKTFPTNDCSMCILAPKLVDAGNHPNIEILASSDLLALDGEPGRMKATVLRRARFIDEDKCTGCSACSKVCPVELPSIFNAGIGTRKAADRLYPQAVPNTYAITKNGRAPCSTGCPIDTSIQAYISLIAAGQTKKAAEVIRRENPLPSICGRVCFAPCMDYCNRAEIDEPLNIRALKRYALEKFPDTKPPAEIEPSGKKVAIIGSGPAGLAAAHSLASHGHGATVFEALPVLGGMLAVGIPRFRLPQEVLDQDIAYIRSLGVEFKTSAVVGENIPVETLMRDFDAVFVATGAQASRRMKVPGEGLYGILSGIDFLRCHAIGERDCPMGKNVAVIGGGNTAIDAARTALRLGAEKVRIVYRRQREQMLADDKEIEAALAEGIEIDYLAAPVEAIGDENGRVCRLACVRNELGEPDESGRRRPLPIEGSEYSIEADTVITAISETPDAKIGEAFCLEMTEWNTLVADELTMQTSREGIFAGGDGVLGPSSVIQAIDQGKRAARAIENYLNSVPVGDGISPRKTYDNPLNERDIKKLKKENVYTPAVAPAELPVQDRIGSFDEVEAVYTDEEARAEASRCLNCAGCCECFRCVEVCKAGAIDHLMEDQTISLDVGAVVLALGNEVFEAGLKGEYGFGVYPNVVTSLQYERILCASGPFSGHVQRPSDGEEPKRIAFLQCVGSRDLKCGREYCSSVCCTYATKEAILTREHCPEAEITIFGMDFRTHGKDFEKFLLRAQDQAKVRYIHSRVPAVDEDPKSGNLWLSYQNEEGIRCDEEFDLVVLSVGLQVPERVRGMAGRIGVSVDEYGFALTEKDNPLATTRAGVFVCGAFEAPKDIPETVMQASAAAARAAGVLNTARGQDVSAKEYPPEKDVRTEAPRVGVFVCSCGSNIASVVDVKAVTKMAKTLDNVVWSENVMYSCSADALAKMKTRIEKLRINRVVVASCSPRTHEMLFQETIREAGLNRYLFEMANIRDHCSWVHRDDPKAATEKAMDLVAGAVAKARLAEPLHAKTFEIVKSAVIIGGGIAGMTAALSIGDQGFDAILVEKKPALGGLARRIHETIEGVDVGAYLEALEAQVRNHPRIRVYTNATLGSVTGSVGNFTSLLSAESGKETLKHGVVVVATGGSEYAPTEYGYGEHPGVMTQMELEEKLSTGGEADKLNSVVMIQCVGSRTPEHPNCSRVCCAEAVKNANTLKKKNPSAEVIVLYRDLRTYGLMEKYYREARERGVLFVRYNPENPPHVRANGSLSIRYHDGILRRDIEKQVDAVVLSVGIRPAEDNQTTAPMLKVPLTEDGHFFEAHVKLRPVDFSTDGIFVAGLAHGPKMIHEAAVQGMAAASRAATILSQDRMEALATTCEVDPALCSGCKLCNTLCAYDAISFDAELGVSVINPAACKGCGTCSANCPSQAITAHHFRKDQLFDQITAIAQRRAESEKWEPKILAFLCNWCSYGGADLAGISRTQYPPNIRAVRVMCSGRVTPLEVMKALEEGFDGVWVSGCHPGDCHYTEGNYHARRRWMVFRELLKEAGIDERRVQFSWISASENQKFADIASDVVEQIRVLGPNEAFENLRPTRSAEPSYF